MMRPPKPSHMKGDNLQTEPNRGSVKRKENNDPSVIIEEAAPSHVTNMLEDIEGKSEADETYEEMFRDIGGRSRPIPALNGGVPIF